MISAEGWFRGVREMLGRVAATALPPDPNEKYDPTDDPPFNIIHVRHSCDASQLEASPDDQYGIIWTCPYCKRQYVDE